MNQKLHKIKVCQLARIPCANSGYYLSQLINDYSQLFESRYILGSEYSQKFNDIVPFRKFPADLFWQTDKEHCIQAIKEADIVHIHHGFWGETKEIQDLLKSKKVVTTVYDLSLINNEGYFRRKKFISDAITVADQPAQKRTFSKWSTMFLPLVNCLFDENVEKNSTRPLIVFSPTNRYPITNNSSKGYYEVLKIIEELGYENYDFEFKLIEGVSHEEDLNEKRKADIIIDDIINATFHNTSLQAACFGAIALTGYSGQDYPFIRTDLKNLKETLIYFISHPDKLKEEQFNLSEWRRLNYHPYTLLRSYEELYLNLLKPKFNSNLEEPKIIPLTISEFLKILTQQFNVCLLKESCLNAVLKNQPNLNELTIAVQTEENLKTVYELYNDHKWDFILKASIHYPLSVKPFPFNGLPVFVPLPVVAYLEKEFQKTYKELSGLTNTT